MSFKDKLLPELEKNGEDMTKASAGGEFKPLAAGKCRLRLFAYIELGKHERKFKNTKKVVERVKIGFEVTGPNHPPRDDGKPHVVYIEETKSLNQKSHFFKLFSKLNHAGTAKHIIGCLAEGYRGEIFHREYTKGDGSKGVAVELKAPGETYVIQPPFYQDEETGETKRVAIEPLKSEERVFLWDRPDMEQWASIFIDGEYEERTKPDGTKIPAKSKNVDQARIMSALNFKGSPAETMLKTNGHSLDIPDAEIDDDGVEEDAPAEPAAAVPAGTAATDALNGVV